MEQYLPQEMRCKRRQGNRQPSTCSAISDLGQNDAFTYLVSTEKMLGFIRDLERRRHKHHAENRQETDTYPSQQKTGWLFLIAY